MVIMRGLSCGSHAQQCVAGNYCKGFLTVALLGPRLNDFLWKTMNTYEIQDKHGDCICLQLARSKQDALDIAQSFHGDKAVYAETIQIKSRVSNEATIRKTQ